MAETTINVQPVATNGGTELTFVNADTSNGNKVSVGGGDVFLYIWNNGSTGQAIVTLDTPLLVNGLAVANVAITVEIGEIKLVRLSPPELYAQPSGADIGTVTMATTGTGNGDVDLAAFK